MKWQQESPYAWRYRYSIAPLSLSPAAFCFAHPQIFGSAGLAYATAALTVTTLFFGELLPKALGVNNAEVVARRVLPIIIVLSVVLNPVAKTFTLISSVGAVRMVRHHAC